ncbi:rRNA processing protein [Umbelopsis sp. WA50703]
MRHYNANTRKGKLSDTHDVANTQYLHDPTSAEAITGIQDMCEQHPGLLSTSLNSIVNASLKTLVDEDRDVRKALLEFMKSSFPELDQAEILPFLSLLTIYTCSAITHIYEDVRADAIKFMDLWIELAPDFIVSKYWDKVLGNYISLVAVDSNASNISKSNVSGLPNITANMSSASVKNVASKSNLHSHKAKVDILSSICNLLNAGMSLGSDDPYWFFAEYLNDQSAKKRFRIRCANKANVSDRDRVSWQNDGLVNYRPTEPFSVCFAPSLKNISYATASHSHLNLFEASEAETTKTTAARELTKPGAVSSDELTSGKLHDTKSLIQIFQPSLLSAWLDTAPTVFSSSAPIIFTPALQTLHLVLKIMAVLWRAALGREIGPEMTVSFLNAQLESIIKHFMTYFPYGSDSLGRREQKVDVMIQEMNIIICELVSLFLLALKTAQERENSKKISKRTQQGTTKHQNLEPWTTYVVDYVLHVLGREAVSEKPAKRQKLTVMPESMTTTSTEFRADQLQALLPSVWGLLNSLPSDEQVELLDALLAYYNRLGARSPAKHIALGFIARMFLIQFEPQYNGMLRIHQNTIVTEKMRLWLLTLPKLLWEIKDTNIETTSKILDIFNIVAKCDGERIFGQQLLTSIQLSLVPYFFVTLPTKGDVYGPFISLPTDQQKQVIEFLYYAGDIPEKLVSSISRCQQDERLSLETLSYLNETITL